MQRKRKNREYVDFSTLTQEALQIQKYLFVHKNVRATEKKKLNR